MEDLWDDEGLDDLEKLVEDCNDETNDSNLVMETRLGDEDASLLEKGKQIDDGQSSPSTLL